MLTIEPNNGLEKFLCDQAYETGTPIAGGFELLPVCNMNCKMCYIRVTPEEMYQVANPMSGKEWLRIGREAAECGTLFLLLTGGEPLLHPDFLEIYNGLRSMGIHITINTNGTLITPEIAEAFRNNMPRRVNISLYGSSNATYEKLCGNPEGYTQVMRGLHFLRDAGVPVKLNYTLAPHNYPDMEKVLQIGDELGLPVSVPTYMFPPVRKKDLQNDGKIFSRLSPKEAAKAQMETLDIVFGRNADYLDHLQSILQSMQPREDVETAEVPGGYLCSAGVRNFWVNWKGELTACGMLPNTGINLKSASFAPSWEEIKMSSKHVYTSNKCFNCRFRRVCQNCAASAFAETGKYDGVPSYHCEMCEEYERLLIERVEELNANK